MAQLAENASKTFSERMLGKFGVEFRSSLENPQTPLSYPAEWLLDIFNGGRTDAGLRISEMTALQAATVFQCVMIIANGIAAHPFNVYERSMQDGLPSRKIAYSHPLYYLLSKRPNNEMTSSTLRRTFMCHKLLWGNAYAEVERNRGNKIVGIWPRNPARTRPVRLLSSMEFQGDLLPAGTMMYETYDFLKDSQIMEQDSDNQNYGMRRLVLAEDMIHVPGLSLDGRLGQDVVQLARQAIGLALATEKYGAKFFGNGAIPQGVLGVPSTMSDVQWETLRRSWAESHGGENAQKTGVLPPGVTYTKTGSSPNEAQNIETRQYQTAQIASFFNVPGHMVGVNGDDAGKSTVEQSSIEFKLFCVDPHAVDLEQESEAKLFPPTNAGGVLTQNKFFAAIDLRKLMYPDATSRATLYNGGKQWGYLNTNSIHEMEGMNPVTDGSGDKYWMPINMQDAAAAAVHGEAVMDGLNDGTLAATPANVSPIGNHPIIKAQQKADAASQEHDLAKHKISADAQVKISKNQPQAGNGNDPHAGPGTQGTPKKLGDKKKAKRDALLRTFGGMFADAVGRVGKRSKVDHGDYVRTFGPLLSAIVEAATEGEERVDASQFINDALKDIEDNLGKESLANLPEPQLWEKSTAIAEKFIDQLLLAL